MPNYDYKCDTCDNVFEEFHSIADRNIPVGKICGEPNCEGKIESKIGFPGFAYDNIKTKHSKKEPGWFREKMQEMKVKVPGNTL